MISTPATVPPSVAVPDTASTSDAPAPVPPTSSSSVPEVCTRLPAIDKVPAVPAEPGTMLPSLVSVPVPPPTLMLPLPASVPPAGLTKPSGNPSVAPADAARVPAWVMLPPRVKLPCWTDTVPVLLKLSMPSTCVSRPVLFRVPALLTVVVPPALAKTLEMLLLRLTTPPSALVNDALAPVSAKLKKIASSPPTLSVPVLSQAFCKAT